MDSKAIVIKISSDIKDLIPLFLENRKKDILALEDFISSDNFKEIQYMAHKIAGNSGGYGFQRLGEIGSKIESAAEANNKDIILTNLAEMKEYLSLIKVEYI